MADISKDPQPEEYAPAIERAFVRCPHLKGLRFLSVEVRLGFAAVTFEGPADDFRGPYGAKVRLPENRHDELWTSYVVGDGTVDDWAHAGVAMRAVDAHTTSRTMDRGYTVDGVWWILDDFVPTQ